VLGGFAFTRGENDLRIGYSLSDDKVLVMLEINSSIYLVAAFFACFRLFLSVGCVWWHLSGFWSMFALGSIDGVRPL